MKSKSIGSLIVLALLAPSCGGGKVAAPMALTPRWISQFRIPTSVNLTAVKVATPAIAVVAGEAGNFLLTEDGGITWTPMEYAPASRGGDVLAMDASNGTVVAVGSDESTGKSAAWTSTDGLNFGLPDDPTPRFTKPWVDVTLVAPATASVANSTYRLRDDGKVDAYQGSFLYTADSTIDTVGGPTPWTKAYGIWYQGLTGVGMVCGDNGGLGQIRYSVETNSAHWITATITPTSLNSVKILRRFSMLAASSGFACGDAGTVIQSTALGSWTQIPGFPAVNFRGIHFPLGADVGWVVGENGNIYKLTYDPLSTNWTWTHQGIGVTTQHLNAVAFYNNRFGFAVGNAGAVLGTTDGGANWFEISFPPLSPTPQFNAVDFSSNAQVGLAVGNGGTVQRTLDGGNTWEPFATGVPNAVVTGVSIPHFGGGDIAYLCGLNFIRAQSTLKGTASSVWATQTVPAGNYQAIHFALGDSKGVVAGLAGAFAITANGGTTWNTAFTTPPPAGVNYRALCSSPDGGLVFAAGDTGGNGVLTSSDVSGAGGALVWSSTLPNITGVQINAVQAPMGTTTPVFAGTQDGKVYRLNAAQSAWDTGTVVAGANTAVVGLAFVSEMRGWAVVQDTAAGSQGGVFETKDRGTTWTRSYLHVKVSNTNLLRAIWMNGLVVGTVVGDNGMILKTTTGGE